MKVLVGILAALVAGGVGLPIPEELPLLAAGAAAWRGDAPLPALAATCLVGLVAGDSILFFLGRRAGDRLARWFKPGRIAKIERHFARHSRKTLVMARFAPGARALFFLCAGAARMRFTRFLAQDVVGAALGTALWLYAGFRFGSDLERVRLWIGTYHRLGTLGLVIAAAIALAIVRLRAARARMPNPP